MSGGSEAEVSEFNLNLGLVLSHQDIIQLDVPMHDIVTMEVTDSLTKLGTDPPALIHAQRVPGVEIEEAPVAGILNN